ncbi:bifunctional alpha/beta hydrolase/OsmC family protein [Jiulongibacter sediminis]|uniref:bifunctional alpha/beta hydrolase/OsmC family protein n=1 Tax=Jiulongibacter sediminis TaxID=1605367 RepID=UPI0026EE465D|nr:bifunctional alpha/beta hydrolase/OsmC family protein [Jiulongibacter sediminis]
MKSNHLTIVNSKGIELKASLELPANEKPWRYAIFAHCFTCSSDLSAVRNISRELANYGFGVIRFDFTGLGQSEGEFKDSHFSANVQDIIDVSAYMEVHFKAPNLLVGHSLGGAAVIIAGQKLENIKAIATIGAPVESSHVEHLFETAREELTRKQETKINIGGRPFTIDAKFLEELDSKSVKYTLKEMRKPILILHSPQDKIVSIENAKEIYNHAYHPKSFISLDGADHLLSRKEDSVYSGKMIGTWVDKFLPAKPLKVIDTLGEQVVGHLDLEEDHFTTTIQTAKHTIIADEPASVGGDDFGPSPYELLNSALAACTAMTLKLYAERKKWPLEEVYVYLSHSRKHVEDLKSDRNEKIDVIEKKLKLVGDLEASQRERLKEIASKCPVHRTLITTTQINTEVID